jgi:hypothetical protein
VSPIYRASPRLAWPTSPGPGRDVGAARKLGRAKLREQKLAKSVTAPAAKVSHVRPVKRNTSLR